MVGEERAKASSQGLAIQDIRLHPPRLIEKSNVWVVEVSQRKLEYPVEAIRVAMEDLPEGPPPAMRYRPEFLRLTRNPTVNLIFYSDEAPDGRLLFDREVLIRQVEIPRDAGSELDHLLYTVVEEDTNGDGILGDRRDEARLWISDLRGSGLLPVMPDSLVLQEYAVAGDARTIHIRSLVRPPLPRPPEQWQEVLSVYDMKRAELAQLPLDPSVIQRARQLLQR